MTWRMSQLTGCSGGNDSLTQQVQCFLVRQIGKKCHEKWQTKENDMQNDRVTKAKLRNITEADMWGVKTKRNRASEREEAGSGCHSLPLLWMTGVLHSLAGEGKPHVPAASAFILWTLNKFYTGPKVM